MQSVNYHQRILLLSASGKAEFDAAIWDRQFEADVAAGRLDALAEKALQDLKAGRCTESVISSALASALHGGGRV